MTSMDPPTMTIDGRPHGAAVTYPVINPATEEVLAEAPNASGAELDAAVAAARRAFPGWAATSLAERQRLAATAGERIMAAQDELARLLTAEQGKPTADAMREVMGAAYWFSVFAGMDVPVEVTEDSADRRVEVRHVPIGVVGAMATWNFPVLLACLKVAPALVAGNAVVLKPATVTPLTTLRLGQLLRDVFPAGVLNVVSGDDALGPLFSAHPGFDKISFTGSTETGKRVMASAASTLKRITLELGGNDAAIVLPDVDVDKVAEQIFAAAFTNSGQICIAVKRLYIHTDIYDRFAAALVELVKEAKVGDGAEQGTRFGPIQNKAQYDRVRELIEDARDKGYRFLMGGEVMERPGYFLPLTLIDNPPDDARIVREEQFGPVLPLLRYDDVDDAVARANDTEFGLGAHVWGGDAEAALAVGSRLQSGNIWINQGPAIFPHAPFGGHKTSGIGSESSLAGLLAFTNPQTVAINKTDYAAA